ncbi:ABC transporter ATP-binding protein (plasmid) [Rhizobium sp. Pop5]|uniref:ABC transporter ATP-binding protein n=1 Tax=unclassified Rhizobium TaxID=2613769 RepID=UPI000283AA6C|nr:MULTISPECIES: ABC transporter ATP-binding protein [unclassified Rhizobium]ARM89779.1 high-affinity branched-chain amino acid ABC transporter ATP-binding protein [Rhizobium sp. CIAT894]EJZ18570.1 ABC branched-chain amino acid family transporter, ATPase subunit [Rhizobium sp. Pop5]UVD60417.1 ABC transporter ATP-binding protein [Rhizobium sp. Pop5]
MLEARNLSVRYGKHLALNEVSIKVGPGECVAILGANGAGKSTLLRGLTSMVRLADNGEVVFRDKQIARIAPHKLVELGIAHVPEGRGVFTEMTVDENLRLGANPRRARQGADARREEVLTLFPRLAERSRQRVGTMSGGEQQMVAVARALMSKPDVLLLDEPSLGLAPIVVGELFQALRRVRDSGISMLVVEQNVRASLALANRGYLLEAGRIVGQGIADTLMDDPGVRKAFLGH